MMIIIPLHVFFQCHQQAPESQHSQEYKTLICYACISCAPEKAPEFGTFSTLATVLNSMFEVPTLSHLQNVLSGALLVLVSALQATSPSQAPRLSKLSSSLPHSST